MHRVLFSGILGLLSLLAASRPDLAGAQEDSSAGTRDVYEITFVDETAGAAGNQLDEGTLTITLFRIDRGRGREEIIVLIDGDPAKLRNDVPMGSIGFRPKEGYRIELEHPVGRLISRRVVPLLLEAPPPDRLAAPSEGTESIRPPSIPLRREITVRYTSGPVEGKEGEIRHRRELDAPVLADLGVLEIEVQSFRHELVLSRDDLRILRATLEQTVAETYEGRVTTKTLSLRAEEVSHAPLSAAQAREIQDHYALLLPIARASFPGRAGETPGKQQEDPRAMLASYREKLSHGELAGALDWLEASLTYREEERRLADPKRSAATLVNTPAPDFTLRDLAGNEVSLASHKGKVVLLFFFSYT